MPASTAEGVRLELDAVLVAAENVVVAIPIGPLDDEVPDFGIAVPEYLTLAKTVGSTK